jgi:thiamine-phosphate pyrophosphorylase
MTVRSVDRDPRHLRDRLADARLMLLFTPELCAPHDPMAVLEAALGSVDVVQIRPKRASSSAPCTARETYDACVRVLDLLSAHAGLDVLVIVDDRVDVAVALRERGCAGVHLGQDDCPVAIARQLLGSDLLIGLSTHDVRQVGEAGESAVDYLGFGPVHATSTKGYAHGLGSETAWIASEGSHVPVFPIGGIDATNIEELARIGRAAVSSAILRADDPGKAAGELRSLLLS